MAVAVTAPLVEAAAAVAVDYAVAADDVAVVQLVHA